MGFSLIDAMKNDQYDVLITRIQSEPVPQFKIESQVALAYCTNCEQQVNGFFTFDRIQYGAKGHVSCNHCGTTIHCSIDMDSPNKDRIIMSTTPEPVARKKRTEITMDLEEIYLLTSERLAHLQSKAGIDLFQTTKKRPLSEIVTELTRMQPSSSNRKNKERENTIFVHSEFPYMPPIVQQWFRVLDHYECL